MVVVSWQKGWAFNRKHWRRSPGLAWLKLCAPPTRWNCRISSRGKIGFSASLLQPLTSLFSLCVLISLWGANTCSDRREFPSKAHFNPQDWLSLGKTQLCKAMSAHHEVMKVSAPLCLCLLIVIAINIVSLWFSPVEKSVKNWAVLDTP